MKTAAWLPSLALTALLAGCQQKTDTAPVAAAASAPAGAADDSPASLMAAAFSGWTAAKPHIVQVPSGEGQRLDPVLVSPAISATLDADHRILVVVGVPDDGHGQPEQSHATAVNLGLYGFERRGGRWVKTFERASLAWVGSYGQPGDIGLHALGAGHTALSVDNEYCGQGRCSRRLQVFALAMADARLLIDQMISDNTTDATVGCAEWLAGKPLPDAETPDAMTPANCYDISGKWHFEARAGDAGWPDLVVSFTGGQAVQDAQTGRITPRVVDDQLVLRHDGGSYKTLSGRNPAQGS